jgi:hypothetical protein
MEARGRGDFVGFDVCRRRTYDKLQVRIAMSSVIPDSTTQAIPLPLPIPTSPVDRLQTARSFLDKVMGITREIYSGQVESAAEEDREIADDGYFVIRVGDAGRMEQMLERSDRWHRRLLELPGNVRSRFILDVDVVAHDR